MKKNKNKLDKTISIFSSKSFKNVLKTYKKNKEQKKIKEIKLKKLAESNQILKDRNYIDQNEKYFEE